MASSFATTTLQVPPLLNSAPEVSRNYELRFRSPVSVTRSPAPPQQSMPAQPLSHLPRNFLPDFETERELYHGNSFFSPAATSTFSTIQELTDAQHVASGWQGNAAGLAISSSIDYEHLPPMHEIQGPRTRGSHDSEEEEEDSLIQDLLRETTLATAEECPICIQSHTTGLMTSCDHFFCSKCITSWLREADTCPLCRTELLEECMEGAGLHTDDNLGILMAATQNSSTVVSEMQEEVSYISQMMGYLPLGDGDGDDGLAGVGMGSEGEDEEEEEEEAAEEGVQTLSDSVMELQTVEVVHFVAGDSSSALTETRLVDLPTRLPTRILEPERLRPWWGQYTVDGEGLNWLP